MNTLTIPCACKMKDCNTLLIVEDDDELSGNLRFIIKDDKHDLFSWASLDKQSIQELLRKLRIK